MNNSNVWRKKKKDRFASWPKRVLALVVMGFCLFVGIDNSHLLLDGLALLKPLEPGSYGLVRQSVDEAYTQRLFSGRQPAAPPPAASMGGESGAEAPPPEEDGGENTVNALLKDAFLGINGLATGAMGQRELNGIVKLDNGYICPYLSEKQDLGYQISKTLELARRAEQNGSKFVFVMAPHQIDKYDPQLPSGVTDVRNEMADDFLAALGEAGVASIDIRELMRAEGFNHYAGFFRTDHHWTPQTSVWAVDRVMRELEAWGWLDTEGIDLSLDDFGAVGEGVRFYGTNAERTGAAFAGEPPDTLYNVLPNEELTLRLRPYDGAEYDEPVSFEAAFRNWQYAVYDEVQGPDAYYLYKTLYDYHVLNESAPIQSNLTLICDSFGVPFQSFAACYVEELYCFQGRQHPDMLSSIQRSDIVMVLYTPNSLDILDEDSGIFEF